MPNTLNKAGSSNYHDDIAQAKAEHLKHAPTGPLEVDFQVQLRGVTAQDTSFVIDSWADSYRHSGDMRGVDPELYKIEIRARIYGLLPKCRILIACDAKQPSNIFGWICYSPAGKPGQLATVHYAVTKPSLQRKGVFKALLEVARASQAEPEGPIFASHRTLPMQKGMAEKLGLVFNPFLAGGVP